MPQAYGEVYNIGADHAYTVLELAESRTDQPVVDARDRAEAELGGVVGG